LTESEKKTLLFKGLNDSEKVRGVPNSLKMLLCVATNKLTKRSVYLLLCMHVQTR